MTTYEEALKEIRELAASALCDHDDDYYMEERENYQITLNMIQQISENARPGKDKEKEEMISVLSSCWECVDEGLRDEIDEVTAPYTSFFDEAGNEVSWEHYKASR